MKEDEEVTEIHRGDLFWVTSREDRGAVPPIAHPHLVLQEDVFNQSRIQSVIMVALSTHLRRAEEPGNVLLEEGEGGLPARSVIVVSRVEAVPKRDLGAKIGALPEARVVQAIEGLRFQQRAFLRGR